MKDPIFILGNSLIELTKVPAESVDLVFVDPPYWMRVEGTLQRVEGNDFKGCNDEWDNQFDTQEDYKSFTTKWLTECKRILAPNGSIWVIGGMQCIYTIGGIMQDLGFWFLNDVIWHKTNPTPNFKGTRLTNSHETLLWATKSEDASFTFHYKTAKELNDGAVSAEKWATGLRKQMGSVWRFPVCQGKERLQNAAGEKLHSTQKPEQLMQRLITISSNVGDTVLDPFSGTMTTGAVATQLGRSVIMIEQEEEYFKAGQQRVLNTMPLFDDFSLATFDVKPPRTPVSTLLKAGYLKDGESLYFKASPSAAVKDSVALLSDGKVRWGDKQSDIHAAAGLFKNGGIRQNGWLFWYVKRNSEHILIDVIRKQYRQEQLGYVAPQPRTDNNSVPLLQKEVFERLDWAHKSNRPLEIVHQELLPRLLQQAGLVLRDSVSIRGISHHLCIQKDGTFLHVCHLTGTITQAAVQAAQQQHHFWKPEYTNLRMLWCHADPSVLKPFLHTQHDAPVCSPATLFSERDRAHVWTVFQRWIERWEELNPKAKDAYVQIPLTISPKS